eukprot:SAG31_NODE_630_length_13427_cov_27.066327_3_plen_61_part_00
MTALLQESLRRRSHAFNFIGGCDLKLNSVLSFRFPTVGFRLPSAELTDTLMHEARANTVH